MRPPKTYPYDPDLPYVVLNVFSDEGIARFRYESDAVDFAEEDPTMYVIDTIPKGEGETND